MKLSEAIKKLVDDLTLRGDAELVERYGEIWAGVGDINVYRTPLNAPEGTAYIQIDINEP
jgi:hypothetical protein